MDEKSMSEIHSSQMEESVMGNWTVTYKDSTTEKHTKESFTLVIVLVVSFAVAASSEDKQAPKLMSEGSALLQAVEPSLPLL
jgi:hypothetical protein